jgi:hypothetical protein
VSHFRARVALIAPSRHSVRFQTSSKQLVMLAFPFDNGMSMASRPVHRARPQWQYILDWRSLCHPRQLHQTALHSQCQTLPVAAPACSKAGRIHGHMNKLKAAIRFFDVVLCKPYIAGSLWQFSHCALNRILKTKILREMICGRSPPIQSLND